MTQTFIEHEVRLIDAYGDSIEVEQFDTLPDAEACAASKTLPDGDAIAWAIERKTERWFRNGSSKRTYVVLATGGDRRALQAGQWAR